MTSVLVVDDDAPLGRALARELRQNGYDSVPVSGYDEALQRLAEQSYDVLLTDLRMGDKDGLDLILAIAASFPATRPILMSAYATARDSERAKELGAVRVLCKPFETSEMLQAVERAVESARGFLGSVHGLSLIDMLQMFHYAQRSVSVQVLGGLPAAIHLKSGHIVHATYGAMSGEEALSEILTMPAGSLQTSPFASVGHTISREFQPLILDLLRKLDEQGRGALPLPVDLDGRPEPGISGSSSDGSNGSSGASLELGLDAFPPTPVALSGSTASSAEPAAAAKAQDGDADARVEIELRHESSLLSDACRRTGAELGGDVVCVVVDLDRARLPGHYAPRGDGVRRSEALARATLTLFRDAALPGIGELLGEGPVDGQLGQALRRVELTLLGGVFLARATRQGRRVLALLLGRDSDLRAARGQLDALFPLVEALAP